jgi:hypothetical protein
MKLKLKLNKFKAKKKTHQLKLKKSRQLKLKKSSQLKLKKRRFRQ